MKRIVLLLLATALLLTAGCVSAAAPMAYVVRSSSASPTPSPEPEAIRNGIGNFLKRPRVKIAEVAESPVIIEKGVREFLDTYRDTVYQDGTVAKSTTAFRLPP